MKGIKAVIGVYKTKGPKGGKTEVQSILFPIKYLYSQVKEWLREHGFKYGFIDESKNYWRARQLESSRFIRMRTISLNPGAKWHEEEARDSYSNSETYPAHSPGRAYHIGQADAHEWSERESRKLRMNPRRKSKWYVGIIRYEDEVKYGGIFTSAIIPTALSHGHRYKYAMGPYNTRKEAIRIANYQGIQIAPYKRRLKENPIQSQIVDKIYDKILAIEARKGGDSLWPRENFRHDFKEGAEIFGLKDGSLLVVGKKGKRLWKRINYD